MKNENRTYYYKHVEEAFANIHRATSEMLKDLGADWNMPGFDVLSVFPEKIQWSQHESVVNLNLKEEDLSDDQKEGIALSNKDIFDEIISSLSPIVHFNKYSHDFDRCLTGFTAIIMEAVDTYVTINKNTIFTEESATLTLTNEELYYAFSFLNKDQVREVLWGQPQKVVDRLYNAIKGKDLFDFQDALDENQINPMKSLRYFLISQVNNIYAFSDFIKSPELINSSFLALVLDESGMPDDIIEYIDVFKDSHFLDLKNVNAFNNSESIDFGRLIAIKNQCLIAAHKLFVYSMDMPRLYRKRLLENYNGWRKDYPEAPEIDVPDEFNLHTENTINIANVLIDKWLIDAIHKKMASKNCESSKEAELSGNKSTTCNLLRLPLPSRLINNKIDGLLSNKILQRLHKVYGVYLIKDTGRLISEEEFVYLFSGGIKCPSNYNPPYYWSADKKVFAGLIRLLYDGQEKGLDTIILLSSDVGRSICSIKWIGLKQGLGKRTLAPIENTIQAIVEDVSGKRLREVDLTRQGVKNKK